MTNGVRTWRKRLARGSAVQHDQEAPVVVRASRLRSGRRMYWCGWVAGIVALAALWLTFSSVLSQMVAQIAGQG